jgi:hypothetical protein
VVGLGAALARQCDDPRILLSSWADARSQDCTRATRTQGTIDPETDPNGLEHFARTAGLLPAVARRAADLLAPAGASADNDLVEDQAGNVV